MYSCLCHLLTSLIHFASALKLLDFDTGAAHDQRKDSVNTASIRTAHIRYAGGKQRR